MMSRDVRVVVPNEFNFLKRTSTNNPQAARGIEKLVQEVSKAILTEPGRDIFAPEFGMGLRQIMPRAARSTSEEGLLSDVTIGLSRIEGSIKAQQATEKNEQAEMLRTLALLAVRFDNANLKWEVWIQVANQAGQSASVPLNP